MKEFKAIFHLALPLILNLLAYVAMQFVDTVMLGRIGAGALAASALANTAFMIILVGCIGTLTAVGTLAAQAFGDKDPEQVQAISQQGLWLALFMSIPAIILLWNAHHFLLMIKEPPEVVISAKAFLHGLLIGFLPDLGFIALREFTTAISKPRIVMVIAIAAIPLNALMNYWFIYGGLGIPPLKIFGVGLATSLVSWSMFLSLVIYIARHRSLYRCSLWQIGWPRWSYLKRLLRLGLPVGVSFVVEEGLFLVVALLIGYLGVVSLAAHQIALQCMLAIVMVPIGISQSAAVRVSQLLGLGNSQAASHSAYLAIGAGVGFALIAACFLWSIPQFFVGLFLEPNVAHDQAVIILAKKLLLIIAIFHIIDAAQLITNGALRGYQDTLVPMFLGLISFWLVGIGTGYVLAFKLGYGAQGLWWGLALGITASAILLQWRLFCIRGKRVLRLKTVAECNPDSS